jgi:hypothetical protein
MGALSSSRISTARTTGSGATQRSRRPAGSSLEQPRYQIGLFQSSFADRSIFDRANLDRQDFTHPHANKACDQDEAGLNQMDRGSPHRIGAGQGLAKGAG